MVYNPHVQHELDTMPMFNDSGLHRAIIMMVLFFGPAMIASLFTRNEFVGQVCIYVGMILAGLYGIAQVYQIWKSGN